MVTVKVTEDDEYKTELTEQIKETLGDDAETQLQRNIAVGFAEALKQWGHKNFEIIVRS